MMRNRFREACLLLVALCLCLPGAAWSAGAEVFLGHWEGATVLVPAENEVDLLVDFFQQEDGALAGEMTIPMGPEKRRLDKVQVEGSSIRFEYAVEGGSRVHRGQLSADGTLISGEYERGGQVFPFELERRRREPSPPPALHDLVSDGRDLRELFNRDGDKLRLILIASPTWLGAKNRTRLMQRYVMDALAAPEIRVYAVWIPGFPADDRKAAEAATLHLPDSRVTHFWAPDLTLSDAFKKPLGVKLETVHDVFLIYPPGSRWGESPPVPRSLYHDMHELPEERRFNAVKLAREIGEVLAGR